MGVVLVLRVAGRLELERGVLDVKVPYETSLHLIQESGGMPIKEAAIVDHHMCRKCGQVRGDRPNVQVVDVDDVRVGAQMVPDRHQVHPRRCRLEQDPPESRNNPHAARNINPTTISEAIASARMKPVKTITTPAVNVAMNPYTSVRMC